MPGDGDSAGRASQGWKTSHVAVAAVSASLLSVATTYFFLRSHFKQKQVLPSHPKQKQSPDRARSSVSSLASSSGAPSESEETQPRPPLSLRTYKRKANKYNDRRRLRFLLREAISPDLSPALNAVNLLRKLTEHGQLEELDSAAVLYAIDVLSITNREPMSLHIPVALQREGLKPLSSMRRLTSSLPATPSASSHSPTPWSSAAAQSVSPAVLSAPKLPPLPDTSLLWLQRTFTPLPRRLDPGRMMQLAQAISVSPSMPQKAREAKDAGLALIAEVVEVGVGDPTALAELLKGVDKWSFDVRKLREASGNLELSSLGWYLLNDVYGLVQRFAFDGDVLKRWLVRVENGYCRTEYHNSTHAADVLQTVHFMLSTGGARQYLSDVQLLAMLVGAIIHDLGHDGFNNTFHKNIISERALMHNDQSIQENFHIATFFSITLSDPSINFLQTLDGPTFGELRSCLITLVLHTDMSQHFPNQAHFKSLVDSNGQDPSKWKEPSHTQELMCAVLHASDISNPAKPIELARHWATLCLAEFFKQGNREKSLGLAVSPNCDKDTTVLHKSQAGFISFIVLPTYKELARLLPPVGDVVLPCLDSNLAYWKAHDNDSSS